MAAQPLQNTERLERLLTLVDESLDLELIATTGEVEHEQLANLTAAMRNLDGFVNAELLKEAQLTAQEALDRIAHIQLVHTGLREAVDQLRGAVLEEETYVQMVFQDRGAPILDALRVLFAYAPEVVEA